MRKPVIFLALLSASLMGGRFAKADSCNGSGGANLVQNCGFETGTFSSWSGTTTTDPNNSQPFVANGIDQGDPLVSGTTPFEGSNEAYLGSELGKDTLTQNLTTAVGQQYTIQFAMLNDTTPVNPETNSFLATFGSTTLLSLSQFAADDYTLYTFNVVADSTSTALSFITENDSGDFELDSVSVTAVAAATTTPEPSSFALLGSGLLGFAGVARRRLRR